MSKTVVNKVTKVVWDNGFKPDGVNIPSVTSADEGKVLAVDSNGKWVAASPSAPQSELPEHTAADEGKILKVDDQGDLEWAEDDNTQYTAGDNVSIVNGEISAVDTTYTAGDNVEISADNEISSVNTIVFDAKYFRATDTFQYDADAIAPFLTEVFKNDKRAVVRVQEGNYNNYDIYTLKNYQSGNKAASFSKVNPSIVSANHREIVCSNIALYISNGVGTLTYTNEGVVDLPEGATAGQVPISDGHNGWVAGNIPSELPSVTSVDEGKVLSVDSNGDLEWITPSGGAQDIVIVNLRRDTSNNNALSITDTTYTTASQIQTLVTDGKEVILRVEEDSTEKFEFFTLGADYAIASQRGYMILWNSISVDDFATRSTHFSRIGLLMGTNFVYENMSVNLGGGETLTLLASHDTASSLTKAFGEGGAVPVAIDLTNVDLTGYTKFLVTVNGTGDSLPLGSIALGDTTNQYLIQGRYINNKYSFEPCLNGKFSNGRSTSPSYNVYMRIDITMTSTYLYLWVYVDKMGTSSQTEQQPYLFALNKLDVKLYGIK